MVTFKNLIDKVEFQIVWEKYISFYPDLAHLREKYFQIFNSLSDKKIDENAEEMVIHIDREDYEEDIEDVGSTRELSDVPKDNVGYRVHGKNNSNEWAGYWDISSSTWEHWLGYYIHESVLGHFCYEQIVALCLYEMTWFGITEEEVINKIKNLGEDHEE